MGHQLPLPAGWAMRFLSEPDPRARLDGVEHDMMRARDEVRAVLDRYAEKHGIPSRQVTEAVSGYAGDMLSDMFFETTSRLRREIEGRDLD